MGEDWNGMSHNELTTQLRYRWYGGKLTRSFVALNMKCLLISQTSQAKSISCRSIDSSTWTVPCRTSHHPEQAKGRPTIRHRLSFPRRYTFFSSFSSFPRTFFFSSTALFLCWSGQRRASSGANAQSSNNLFHLHISLFKKCLCIHRPSQRPVYSGKSAENRFFFRSPPERVFLRRVVRLPSSVLVGFCSILCCFFFRDIISFFQQLVFRKFAFARLPPVRCSSMLSFVSLQVSVLHDSLTYSTRAITPSPSPPPFHQQAKRRWNEENEQIQQ